MAHLHEQELHCRVCDNRKEMPTCCGNDMEHDHIVFFCSVCHREVKHNFCCGQEMEIRTKVKNIKKELFKAI